MNNILQYVQDNKEKITLVLYFVLILGLAAPLSQMLATAWEQANLARSVVRLRLFLGADHQAVSISVFGLYAGLLALMTVDRKKRWQAFLLWLGTVVGLIALRSSGLFLPNVDLFGRLPILLGGFVAGVLIGGGGTLVRDRDFNTLEFRWASRAIYVLLAAFILISFLELHVEYPNVVLVYEDRIVFPTVSPEIGLNSDGLVWNAVLSGGFILVTRQFITYDAEKNFFILGPRASGKSLFLIGAYLEALERTKETDMSTPLNPSQDLMSMLEALDRQVSEWIVEATGRGELKALEFQYVHGSVFPTNVKISAFDYAGEYLSRIPDALTGAIDSEEMDTTLRRLVEGVNSADTLLLVVDVDRFVNNDPLEITEYFSILQSTDSKNVMIIATKADVMLDDFEEEKGIDAHLYFDEFRQFVTTRLRQNENVDALVQETSVSEIHPVYYQTKLNENENRVPMRDDSGSVMTVGYDELLDDIGRI